MGKVFLDVNDVREILGISESKAYKVIREANKDLKAQGYITVAGKLPAKYVSDKLYGGL